MGLAACFHMLKEYKSAAEIYAICGMIDPESPIPYFHASDCYLQMHNSVAAIVTLEMAIKRAGDKPQYATLKDRAALTVASLKQELKTKGS
jgi:type III secretion system low calcium response chaperone LcrH/SycD